VSRRNRKRRINKNKKEENFPGEERIMKMK
jgi:hypothetical protein